MTMQEQPTGRIYEFTVADRITAARKQADMEQGDLADITGISRNTISNYERGATTPGKGPVRLIAWATGFDYDWLMTGNVPPTSRHARTCVWSRTPLELVA